jgi:hypothetical protein
MLGAARPQDGDPSELAARRAQPTYEPSTGVDGRPVEVCQACHPPTEVTGYRQCTERFTMSTRWHHCRYCGLVICSGCSRYMLIDRWLEKAGSHRLCETDGRRPYQVTDPSAPPDPMGGERVRQRVCHCCAVHAPAEMAARDVAREQRQRAAVASRQRQSAIQPAGRSGVLWKQGETMGCEDWTLVFAQLHGCWLTLYKTTEETDGDDTGIAYRRPTGSAIAEYDLYGATVGPPKTARRGRPHCWRLDKRHGQATWPFLGRSKVILAATDESTGKPWGEWFRAAVRMQRAAVRMQKTPAVPS